jgi:hypothetical protein
MTKSIVRSSILLFALVVLGLSNAGCCGTQLSDQGTHPVFQVDWGRVFKTLKLHAGLDWATMNDSNLNDSERKFRYALFSRIPKDPNRLFVYSDTVPYEELRDGAEEWGCKVFRTSKEAGEAAEVQEKAGVKGVCVLGVAIQRALLMMNIYVKKPDAVVGKPEGGYSGHSKYEFPTDVACLLIDEYSSPGVYASGPYQLEYYGIAIP